MHLHALAYHFACMRPLPRVYIITSWVGPLYASCLNPKSLTWIYKFSFQSSIYMYFIIFTNIRYSTFANYDFMHVGLLYVVNHVQYCYNECINRNEKQRMQSRQTIKQ